MANENTGGALAAAYADAHQVDTLAMLAEFLRFPSISSHSANKPDMLACAEWLAGKVRALGFDRVAVMPTAGHPVVYGEMLRAPGKPTVLIYGHYDVQPVDPLDLWDTPPFEPTFKGDLLFARGSSDDKGQIAMHLAALEAHVKTSGALPVNVKVLFEGEEEIGSRHLGEFIDANRDLLRCDTVVISDSDLFAAHLPTLGYGLRGLAYFQIDVQCAARDLHSGSYGGGVGNPIEALAKILAALKGDDGRILIPGFYDDVREITAEEKAAFARLPFDEAAFLADAGARTLHGEAGYSTLERLWARPTLDPNGIWGGFTGEGSKTVLPARASAKVSCRLVADQDPHTIQRLFVEHVRRVAPAWADVEVQVMEGGKPCITPLDHPATRSAARALEKGFGQAPVFTRMGGSIPIVATFAEVLGAPTVLMGIAPPDDHAHAPNERLGLTDFHAGVRSAAYLWEELAK